jgi:hypothetical protein
VIAFPTSARESHYDWVYFNSVKVGQDPKFKLKVNHEVNFKYFYLNHVDNRRYPEKFYFDIRNF